MQGGPLAGGGDPAHEAGAVVDAAGHLHEQARTVVEVQVQRLAGNTGQGRDLGEGELDRAAFARDLPGCGQDAFAGRFVVHGLTFRSYLTRVKYERSTL